MYYSIMSDLKCGTTLSYIYTHIPAFSSLKQHWLHNKISKINLKGARHYIFKELIYYVHPPPKNVLSIVKEPIRDICT